MTKFKYIIYALTLVVFACSNLEEEPVGLLAPEGFFKSPQDVQTTINGAYGNMATEAFWGRKLSLPLMLRSDMLTIGDQATTPRRVDHDRFTVAADNGMITAFWPKSYQIIAGANEAIEGAKSLNLSNEAINPIAAQAYFVRAYTYFHLVQLFGSIPYLDQPVTNLEDATKISKTSEADVYAKIIADLKFAKQWLPDTQPTRAMPSKATAAGYLASVYLTMGDFQNAYTEAKFVIVNEDRFKLELVADFQDLFNSAKQQGQKESLFSIDFNGFSDGDTGRDYQAALTGIRKNERTDGRTEDIGEGWAVAVPSVKVYNTWDGRDYRKRVSLDTIGVFGGVIKPFSYFPTASALNIASAYCAKYTRFPGVTSAGNARGSEINYAQMRYAEVLLIAAEALNETSPSSSEAIGYVNRVRARARNRAGVQANFPADVTTMSKDAFRTMVLEERKWELAFEFKRWYDIKRRKLGVQVFGASGLETQTGFNPARDYFLPLPSDELQRNPNLLPNNPLY